MMVILIMMITRPMEIKVVITSMDFGRTEYLIQQKIFTRKKRMLENINTISMILSNDSLQKLHRDSIQDHDL